MVLDKTPIQKEYQQYLIKLSSDSDLINIIIEKENTIYESNFNLQSLHQHQLLMKSLTTQEIIKFIIELIDMNKIEIKEENMNLKLILISTLTNHSNVELNLQNKNIISNEMKLEGFHCVKKEIQNNIDENNKEKIENEKEKDIKKEKYRTRLSSINETSCRSVNNYKIFNEFMNSLPKIESICLSEETKGQTVKNE